MIIEDRTQSDSRAIRQALEYLRIPKSIKEIEKEIKSYRQKLGLEA
ncbi:MAG TPA: hypothetical protein VEL11_11750 [Candidatus Bathyarchaeia archaeon]|nr:hypothetical protein [Candidatus Bathyarchaeia archaeon]